MELAIKEVSTMHAASNAITPTSSQVITFEDIGKVGLRRVSLRPLEKDEVLIETEASTVSSGTELRCLAGLQSGGLHFPFVPGYAAVGIVRATRSSAVEVGQRVVSYRIQPFADIGTQWGGHSSHHITHASRLAVVPKEVPAIEASLARILAIPQHGVTMTQVVPGDTVIVAGLGIIGLGSALLFAAAGAEVVAVDRSEARVQLARACGLDAIVSTDISKTARDRFPTGVSIFADATGVPAVVKEGLRSLHVHSWEDDARARPNRYLVQGSYKADITIPYNEAFLGEASMLFPRDIVLADIVNVLTTLAAKKLNIRPLLRDVFSPDQAPDVYAQLGGPEGTLSCAHFNWNA